MTQFRSTVKVATPGRSTEPEFTMLMRDRPIIEHSISLLQRRYQEPIVIEVAPLRQFCLAEDYHQKYLDKNSGGCCHITPRQFEMASKALVNPDAYPAPDGGSLQYESTPIQYAVTQQSATEPPFQNEYYQTFEPGIYLDITKGEPLFSSKDEFESGCGWPSFSQPLDPNVIRENADRTHGMIRTEVAHLGHVFQDGAKKLGGLRYCINNASLRFISKEEMERNDLLRACTL